MRARFEQSRGVWLLIVLTAAVFLVDMATGRAVTSLGAKSSAIWAGEVHRLLLATFLHGGLTHIGFNLYALFVFGQVTERILGTHRFLALYVLSGAIGYIVSLLAAPHQLAVGASAAVFGLMGFTLHFRLRRLPLQWSSIDAAFLQIFLINFLAGIMVPNIDQWAHLGGLLGGALCGSLLGLDAWSPGRNRGRRRETAAAAVLIALIFFVGLRPLDTANVLKRLVPGWGQSLQHRYGHLFFPYQAVSPVILWKYVDIEGEWGRVDETLLVDTDRPVVLAVFWRWEPGASFVPGMANDYEIVWRQNGKTVSRELHSVRAPDRDRDLVLLRSVTSPRSGLMLGGEWDVAVNMFDTNIVRLRVKVASLFQP